MCIEMIHNNSKIKLKLSWCYNSVFNKNKVALRSINKKSNCLQNKLWRKNKQKYKTKMPDGGGETQSSAEGGESVCTTKCTVITVSVVTLVAVLIGAIVAVVLLVPSEY